MDIKDFDFSDEEPTRPEAHKTLDTCGDEIREWRKWCNEHPEIAFSERPTKPIVTWRMPNKDDDYGN